MKQVDLPLTAKQELALQLDNYDTLTDYINEVLNKCGSRLANVSSDELNDLPLMHAVKLVETMIKLHELVQNGKRRVLMVCSDASNLIDNVDIDETEE